MNHIEDFIELTCSFIDETKNRVEGKRFIKVAEIACIYPIPFVDEMGSHWNHGYRTYIQTNGEKWIVKETVDVVAAKLSKIKKQEESVQRTELLDMTDD